MIPFEVTDNYVFITFRLGYVLFEYRLRQVLIYDLYHGEDYQIPQNAITHLSIGQSLLTIVYDKTKLDESSVVPE